MTVRARPVLRYHGGKHRLASWIISHLPAHRIYIEPYGGAASVLMRKPRTYAEVYNDLDSEVVNVFRVLRDKCQARRLECLLRLTPFSRDDFMAAYDVDELADPVERARATIIKSFMGFGSSSIHDPRPKGMRTAASTWRAPTGFRSNSARSGTTPAHDWANYPDYIGTFVARLQGVVIENRPALEVIEQHQREDALIFADPPYPHSTRTGIRWESERCVYQHEMTDDQHRELAAVLRASPAKVVISGYACALYDDELYPDWTRYEKDTRSEQAKVRTEVLWVNDQAAQLGLGV